MQTNTILIILGAVLVLAGIIGGGLTLKEIKIPKLNSLTRALACLFGLLFIIGGIMYENVIDNPNDEEDNSVVSEVVPPPTPEPTPEPRPEPTPIQLKGTYSIQQKSNRRYVDAYDGSNDNSLVTRSQQNNDTQRWILTSLGDNTYTIQQKSNRQYVDAYEGSNDNSLVTRSWQNNDTQRWILTHLGD